MNINENWTLSEPPFFTNSPHLALFVINFPIHLYGSNGNIGILDSMFVNFSAFFIYTYPKKFVAPLSMNLIYPKVPVTTMSTF